MTIFQFNPSPSSLKTPTYLPVSLPGKARSWIWINVESGPLGSVQGLADVITDTPGEPGGGVNHRTLDKTGPAPPHPIKKKKNDLLYSLAALLVNLGTYNACKCPDLFHRYCQRFRPDTVTEKSLDRVAMWFPKVGQDLSTTSCIFPLLPNIFLWIVSFLSYSLVVRSFFYQITIKPTTQGYAKPASPSRPQKTTSALDVVSANVEPSAVHAASVNCGVWDPEVYSISLEGE
mgnify:CR=1 FL=1